MVWIGALRDLLELDNRLLQLVCVGLELIEQLPHLVVEVLLVPYVGGRVDLWHLTLGC